MEQIYNFEGALPPALNEKQLLAELERRQGRKRILLFLLGAIFEVFCLGSFASAISVSAPVAAIFLYGYIALSILGGGTFVIFHATKGGAMI